MEFYLQFPLSCLIFLHLLDNPFHFVLVYVLVVEPGVQTIANNRSEVASGADIVKGLNCPLLVREERHIATEESQIMAAVRRGLCQFYSIANLALSFP